MLVIHLRRNEEVDRTGMRRSALVEWYLEQIEEDIANEQALEAQRDLVTRVINNLLYRVRRWRAAAWPRLWARPKWPKRIVCGFAARAAPRRTTC